MNRVSRAALAAALIGVAALGGCATAPAAAPGGALGQVDGVLRQAEPQRSVALNVSPAQVRIGEAITIEATALVPGYLYIYQIGTDGQTLSLVFPNAMDGANHTGTGLVALPRPNWRMPARGPAGVGYFIAVVAQQPQDLTAVAADVKGGRIAIAGPYGAAMATLREVAP